MGILESTKRPQSQQVYEIVELTFSWKTLLACLLGGGLAFILGATISHHRNSILEKEYHQSKEQLSELLGYRPSEEKLYTESPYKVVVTNSMFSDAITVLKCQEGFELPYWDGTQYTYGFGTFISESDMKKVYRRIGVTSTLQIRRLTSRAKGTLSERHELLKHPNAPTKTECSKELYSQYTFFKDRATKAFPKWWNNPSLRNRIYAISNTAYNTGWGGFSRTRLFKLLTKLHDEEEVLSSKSKSELLEEISDVWMVTKTPQRGHKKRRFFEQHLFLSSDYPQSFQQVKNIVQNSLP